jgi:hypothetical protein
MADDRLPCRRSDLMRRRVSAGTSPAQLGPHPRHERRPGSCDRVPIIEVLRQARRCEWCFSLSLQLVAVVHGCYAGSDVCFHTIGFFGVSYHTHIAW